MLIETYYSVVIPYTKKGATIWHPTEATGPFSTLTRGAFYSQEKAKQWALLNLGGNTFSIKEYDANEIVLSRYTV